MTQNNKSYTLKSIPMLLSKDAATFLRESTMLVGTKSSFQYKLDYLSGENPWNLNLNLYAVLTNNEIIALIWISEESTKCQQKYENYN